MDKPSTLLVRTDRDIVDVEYLIEAALEKDDKQAFVSLINSLRIHKEADVGDDFQSMAKATIFANDPVNCAAAILNGETAHFELFDANSLLSDDGHSFLHTAARYCNPRITALLLDRGYNPNLRSHVDLYPVFLKDALPLNVPLAYIPYVFWESRVYSRKSAMLAIILLFDYWVEESITTLSLLANRTKTNEIKREFLEYLRQGKLLEVAALLRVASDRILSQGSEDDDGFKNITEMRVFLLDQIHSFTVDPSSCPESERENQLFEMKETLQFLEIFDCIGDKLIAHTQLVNDPSSKVGLGVASLIQDAGFHVEAQDVYRSPTVYSCWCPSFRNWLLKPRNESNANVFKMELLPSWLKEKINMCEHGAQVNVSDNHGETDPDAMLPLSTALAALCRDKNLSDWTPEKSIYKLIYVFCLKEMKEALETIRLLAEKTEDIEKVSLHCVDEGEVVQFAALLLVAWDRLVPENAEDSVIGRHIWRQIGRINNQESKHIITSGSKCERLDCLKKKKINLLMEWKLLRVLEKGRGVIEEYRHRVRDEEGPNYVSPNYVAPNYEVPYQVARQLYLKAGTYMTSHDVYSDDIECLRPKLKQEEKVRLNEAIDNQLQSMPSTLPKLPAQDEALLKEILQKKQDLESKLSTANWRKKQGCCSLSMCSSQSRAYHTTSPGFDSSKAVTRPVSLLPQVASPSISMFLPSAQICARLFLTAKRSLK